MNIRQPRALSPLFALLALAAVTSLTAQEGRPDYITRQLPRIPAPFARTEIIDDPSFSPSSIVTADPTLPARLQQALEKALAAVDIRARHGVLASVIAPGLGQWKSAAGYSDSIGPAMTDMRFQIGSISKTFIAATIFQLVEEGKLSLSDSLHAWLPSYTNIDSTITIRQLLGHTSGVFDFLNDDRTGDLISDAYLFHPDKFWTPEEILSQHIGTPNFKPGKGTRYSNTGYTLLGSIIESVTGHPVGQEIRNRFLTPLNLSGTYPGWESDQATGKLVDGWSTGFNADTMKQADVSSIPTTAALSMAWTAGGMVSTAGDIARWADALYRNGGVLKDSSLKTMLTFRSTSDGDMGLGAFRYQYYSKIAYGHTGGILGYSSWVLSIPKDSVTVSVLINSFHPYIDDGAQAFMTALLAEVYKPVSGTDAGTARAATMELHNTPNPFRGGTAISFSIPAREHVTLEIFNALGRNVAMPVNDDLEAGAHSVTADLSGLPGGTYFSVLRAGGKREVRAMQLER
ncbi:MAG: serine hydrolase [Bacteroidota bacterium]